MQSKRPSGGPSLPDAAPDGVQNLIDRIFNFGGDLSNGFGSFVSGLAEGIGGESAVISPEVVATDLDLSVVVA